MIQGMYIVKAFNLYFLNASQIKQKLGMTAMIYKINYDKTLNDMEGETKKNKRE